MTRVSRRKFLSRAAVALGATPVLLAAACAPWTGATPTPTTKPAAGPTTAAPTAAAAPTSAPAPTKAPVSFKGTTLSLLFGTYFIKPTEELLKKQAGDWGKENGVTMNVDFLNWPDLQPKIGAAVQAGGVDIAELWPTWSMLYKDSLVDVSDLAEEFGKAGGGYEDYIMSCKDGNRWPAMPVGGGTGTITYRKSYFAEAGVANAEDGTKLDMTWDEYHAVGKKLKAKGKPFGQALGHSTGDPPGLTYPYMWSHGAMEVDKDGKTVLFNKPEFVDGMAKFVDAWKGAYDTTGISWDDSNNNRAFMSDLCSSTFNGISIYFVAKRDNPTMAKDIHHMLMPKGPAGRFYLVGSRTFGILKTSKNQQAAKEFLRHWFLGKGWEEYFYIQEGYQLHATKKYTKDPMWTKDPIIAVNARVGEFGRERGYAGPPNEKAAMAFSKYIVIDTFANAVQSGDAKGAIEWGAKELQRIYGG